MAQNSKWPGTDHLGRGRRRRRDAMDREPLGGSVEEGDGAESGGGCRDVGILREQAYFILLSRVRGPGPATAAASKVF